MNKNLRVLTRRRFTAAERTQWLNQYRASHLSPSQVAQAHGLNLKTFRQWLWRERRRRSSPLRAGNFLEVKVQPTLSSWPWMAELTLASGHTLRLGPEASAEWVGSLVAKLQAVC